MSFALPQGRKIGVFRISPPQGRGWIVGGVARFKYRRKILITEESGADLTDYQVLIELNSENFDFGHAQTNGEDVRFTDVHNNLLDYWIESWDAVAEEAKIWVKVPSIPANSTVEIRMYYGNAELADASDGNAVFELFDDFEGDAIDTDKWDGDIASFSISDSVVSCSTSSKRIYTKTFEITDGIIEAKVKIDTGARGSTWGRASNFDLSYPYNYNINYRYPNEDVRARKWYGSNETILDAASYSHDTDWHIARLILNGSEITFEYEKLDGTNKYSFTTTDTDYTEGRVALATDKIDSGAVYYDRVLVRKYADPEPSVSIGEEETP